MTCKHPSPLPFQSTTAIEPGSDKANLQIIFRFLLVVFEGAILMVSWKHSGWLWYTFVSHESIAHLYASYEYGLYFWFECVDIYCALLSGTSLVTRFRLMGKLGGLDFGLLKVGELRSLFHRPEDLVQLLCPIESCGTGAAHQKITLTSVGSVVQMRMQRWH